MNTVAVVRTTALLVLVSAITTLAGCSTSPTDPSTRPIHSAIASHRDGDPPPPDTPCRSGWVMNDGFWTCEIV